MSLDEKFMPVRTAIYEGIENLFEKLARFFGYPENPGMPTLYELPNEIYKKSQFINSLPNHKTSWPPIQRPETWFETIFGPTPKVDTVVRYVYQTKEEGFYNFYIENYRNIFFLPDWLSEFIQVRLNICLDISVLETIREVLFIGLVVYSQIVILRITISWFIYINPYTFPWCYLAAAVDWTEDVLQGIVPAILGVNITGTIFLGLLGIVADSLNHLVFTMPFLPSEGEETKLLINQEMKNVLLFHYLPISWYRHPIPNDLREQWYNKEPEILDYMQKAYKDLDIQFLPDKIVQQLNQQSNLLTQQKNIHDYISTEILSKENLFQSNLLINHRNFINQDFHSFFINHGSNLFESYFKNYLN